MSPVTPDIEWKEPSQQRSRQRFERILDVAGQLLDQGGSSLLTMDKVAEQAKTSVGSLYHFFPDRDALIAALITERSREMISIFAVSPEALALTPEHAVERMFHLLMKLLNDRPGVRSMFSMAHSDPVIQRARKPYVAEFAQMAETYLMMKFPDLPAERRAIVASIWHHATESFTLLVANQPKRKQADYAREATSSLVAYLDTL